MNRDVKEITAYIIKHEGIWNEPKRFNAVLLDLLPGDDKRSFRNLLVMSVKEDIPKEMQDKRNRTLFLKKYKNRLMQAMPIREEAADEVITFWADLFNKLQVGKKPIREMYYNNEMSGGLYAFLARYDMNYLSDIVGSDLEYALKNGIAPYQRELSQILTEYGYVLEMEPHMLAKKLIRDHFKNEASICNCLQRVGVNNIRDLVDLFNGDTLSNVKGIDEQSVSNLELKQIYSIPYFCRANVVYISPSEEDKEEKIKYQKRISSRRTIVPIWPEYLVNNPYFDKVLSKMTGRWNDDFIVTADQLITIHKALPIGSPAYEQLPLSIILLLFYQSSYNIWTNNDWEKWICYLSETDMNKIASKYRLFKFALNVSYTKTITECLSHGRNAFCDITRSVYVLCLRLGNHLSLAAIEYQKVTEIYYTCMQEMVGWYSDAPALFNTISDIIITYAVYRICGMYIKRQVEEGIDLLSKYIDEYNLSSENAYFLRLSELFKHDSMFGSIRIKADEEISERLHQEGVKRGESEAGLKVVGEEITYDSFLATLLCTWDESWVSFFDLEGFANTFPKYSINSIKRYLSEDVLCFIEKSTDILEYNKMPIKEISGEVDAKKIQREFRFASSRVMWESLINEDF